MVHDCIFQHVNVECYLECTSAHRCHLTEHNVLRDTVTVVLLPNSSRLHQNFDSLLERTSHEGTSISTIDSMSCDGHESSTISHEIAEEGKASIVDI